MAENIIIKYAIRHIPTGHYLPEPMGRQGRGGSHTEPLPFSTELAKCPRIFDTERAAKSALGQWLRGKFYCYRDGDESSYEEDVEIVPQWHRKRVDMEIVPVKVTFP